MEYLARQLTLTFGYLGLLLVVFTQFLEIPEMWYGQLVACGCLLVALVALPCHWFGIYDQSS